MNRLRRISFFIVPAVFIILMAVPVSVSAAGTVSGVITSDTLWTAASSPIVVTGTVTVTSGISLTIEPGTVVQFNPATGLIVAGKLISIGVTYSANTASPSPGFWYGIEFKNPSNVGSVFSNCTVSHGGGGPTASNIFYSTGAFNIPVTGSTITYSFLHGINTRASSPAITNCIIRYNLGYGVFSDLLSNFTMDSCLIANNTQGGLRIPNNSTPTVFRTVIDTNGIGILIDNSAAPTIRFNDIRKNNTGIQMFYSLNGTQPLISDNNIYNNTSLGFSQSGTGIVKAEKNFWGSPSGPFHRFNNPGGLGNGVTDNVDYTPWLSGTPTLSVTNVTANITVTTVWNSGVYWIKNNITVSSALTIKPNVVVKFAPGVYMYVTGSLTADGGTKDSAIIFTSEKDDVYGGDSNGDGFATQPGKGDWNRVELNAGANTSSVIRHCLFQYGGSGNSGNLYVNAVNPSVLSNILSINSSSDGIRFYNCSNAFLDSSVLSGNNRYGILQSYGHLTVSDSKLQGCNYGTVIDATGRFAGYRLSVTDNNLNGIHADGGSNAATIEILNGCYIARNKGQGVYNYYASGAQSFINTVSEFNQYSGLFIHNIDTKIQFTADTIRNNGEDGIISSKAHFLNNVITSNNYPIGQLGALGSTYSGNTISGNKVNNAIALHLSRESMRDTLKGLFPDGMVPGAYVLTENSTGGGVASGDTLVIEQGVVMKFADGLHFNVDGTLIANGTNATPIYFTSWRDSSVGGKTLMPNDFSKPAPNDWQYLQLRGNSDNSQLNFCVFKYGGRSNYGMLYLYYRTLQNSLSNITVRKSSTIGIRSNNSVFTITNSAIDSCGSHAIYAEGSSPRSDVTVRNSVIQVINNIGLRAVHASGFREVSNSIIRWCIGSGIGVDDSSIPQTFLGDSIAHNTEYGIYTTSSTLTRNDIQFIGNFIVDNGLDGIASSAARFIDNEIIKNRFPIGCYGRIGNSYVDNNNVDGNTIAQNTYNNAVILYSSFSDSLKNVFPAAMGSNRAYVLQSNASVPSGKFLSIDSGTVIKIQSVSNSYYSIEFNGPVYSRGTPTSPVIFTSWRDATAGGKTNAVSDTAAPAPGDWNRVGFRDGSGNSVVRFTEFRYGGRNVNETVWFEINLAPIMFSNNTVERSKSSGMSVSSTSLTIDSTTSRNNGEYGMIIYNNANNAVRLRNSRFLNNGFSGVFKDINAKVLEVTNCVLSGNLSNGMYIASNPVNATVIGNTVLNNGAAGIYFTALNNSIDTLLLIAGNKIRNNGGVGLITSRAYVFDDSITGNKYAVGLTGQLSLAGSGNSAGNVYGGNFYAGNLYEGTLAVEGSVYGTLGQVYPEGYSTNVIAARGDLSVPNGSTLNVFAGSIIKFSNEFGSPQLVVDGVLNCSGTANNKIVFTSWKDDVFGGDTNKDSVTTIPQPGNWRQIYLYSDAVQSSFKHTIVKFGGMNNVEMIESNGNHFVMDSCSISYGQSDGMYLGNADAVISGTDFHHHNQYGIYIGGASSPVINYNNIYQNTTGGLYTSFIGAGDTVDARNNFWGAQNGPLVNSGPDQNGGTGNKIAFGGTWAVKYKPFLFTRSGILFGDVSGNGQISAFDGSMVLQYLVNPSAFPLNSIQRTSANVSGDTTVSALDASYILRYVVGLISGFPGLGKQALDADIAAAFSFVIEKGKGANEYDLIIRLNRPSNVYGLNFSLDFDSTIVKPVTMVKTPESDSMFMFSHLPSGGANVAMAGVKPLNSKGNIARFSFVVTDPDKAKQEILFTVRKFILNEQDVTADVGSIILKVDDFAEIPTTFGLGQNYPNPFNPATTIEYRIPVQSVVSITIYNMLGQEVNRLVNKEQQPGAYLLHWNGTDNDGRPVSSGIYFYRISASNNGKEQFTSIKKMMLIK